MLVVRYFLFAGGVLLALLLICAALVPKPPANDDSIVSASDIPPIRIHSDRKLPDRIVFDTNAPMPAAPTVAQVPIPAQQPMAADAAAKAREAFAQVLSADEPKQVVAQAKKSAARPPIKRRVARAPFYQPYGNQRYGYPQYGSPFRMMVAQQPRFGFFW